MAIESVAKQDELLTPPEGAQFWATNHAGMLLPNHDELGGRSDVELDGSTQPDSLEVQEARNEEMASALHTLLVSFPPGEERDGIQKQFPEIGPELSVFDTITVLEPDVHKKGARLQDCLARAARAIGSEERIATILQYPGVTIDQNLEQVRPVREEWLAMSETVNSHAPQMGTVIFIKVGRQILEDIYAGRASWGDVVYGYLDEEQIANQKNLVAKLHDEFRSEPAMPVGHSHHQASFAIPDARFGNLWRLGAKVYVIMGRAIADWVERAEDVTLPQAVEPSDKAQVTTIDPENAERLDALFSNPQFKPYIDAFVSLYRAADEALNLPEGRTLLRAHRRALNTRRPGSPGMSSRSTAGAIDDFVRQKVRGQIEELKRSGNMPPLSGDLEGVFMSMAE